MIKGINWFGFETEYNDLMCTWKHPIEWHLEIMRDSGFNAIRLPFSLDFDNFNSMDELYEKALQKKFDIVLDFHRIFQDKQSYSPESYLDEYLEKWDFMIERYGDRTMAIDIFNEFQGDNISEWSILATEIYDYLYKKFDGDIYVGGYNWGSCLYDFHIDRKDVIYSIHQYPFHTHEWDYCFETETHSKINVGEFGFFNKQTEWGYAFIDFLKHKKIFDTFFWSWSPNSFDTGGILLDDCETIDKQKMNILHLLWSFT